MGYVDSFQPTRRNIPLGILFLAMSAAFLAGVIKLIVTASTGSTSGGAIWLLLAISLLCGIAMRISFVIGVRLCRPNWRFQSDRYPWLALVAAAMFLIALVAIIYFSLTGDDSLGERFVSLVVAVACVGSIAGAMQRYRELRAPHDEDPTTDDDYQVD